MLVVITQHVRGISPRNGLVSSVSSAYFFQQPHRNCVGFGGVAPHKSRPQVIAFKIRIVGVGLVHILGQIVRLGVLIFVAINLQQKIPRLGAGVKSVIAHFFELLHAQLFVALRKQPQNGF